MAQVKFYLKDPTSKSATLIYLFFSFDNQRVKISSGESIKPTLWNAKTQRVKSSASSSGEINEELEKMADAVKSVYRQAKSREELITPEILRTKVDLVRTGKTGKHTLFTFINDYINSVQNLKAKATITIYKNIAHNLKEFEKFTRKEISFENITLDFYNNFTDYLQNEKQYSTNTIAKNIKIIKLFLNEATERGLNTKIDFKSKKFKVVTEETESIYLNEKEIDHLYNLDLSNNSRLEKVRDLFIVGCWTGLRFSDFSQITKENIKDGFINIRTQKTDEFIAVPIRKMVQEIMDKYKSLYSNSLPPAIANQNMNYYLKEIGKLAGLEEDIEHSRTTGNVRVKKAFKKYELIVTHTARRSFATNLYLAGYPAISIMKIIGHRTEKAFLRYIKMNPMENAMKLKEFWERTNS